MHECQLGFCFVLFTFKALFIFGHLVCFHESDHKWMMLRIHSVNVNNAEGVNGELNLLSWIGF